MSHALDSDTALGRWAVDALLEGYVSWREECQCVGLAYQSWARAERDELRLAFAAYLAALDREEHAARIYAEHIERVGRIFSPSRQGQPAIRARTAVTH
jgi:hypothetical protein